MSIKKLKVINLWGAPGSGKSTIAAGLYHHMKVHGYSVELINEYAKQMTWERRHPDHFKNQLYITAKQHNKQMHLLSHDIDICITDSPLPLGLLYVPEDYFPSYEALVWEIYGTYDNFNVVLNPSHSYQPVGRNQSEEEAKELQQQMMTLLETNNVDYKRYNTHFYSHLDVFNDVYEKWFLKQ
mgnify:CR=1 FL=1